MSRYVRGTLISGVIACCFCSLSCGGLPVSRMRMDDLRASIERVSNAGAMACAPRELALARAHFDFAQTELLRGDAKRALRHVAVAEQNVGAAQVLTPDRGCKSARSSAAEVSAIPGGSSADPRQAQGIQISLEADGGGHPTLPGGAVKARDVRDVRDVIAGSDLTLTAIERNDEAIALNASQVTDAAYPCYSSERHNRCITTSVRQASLTPRIYGDRRLDESFEMSYVVLSIGDFER